MELESGKLSSPESSAALAVNCLGGFIERPQEFPALPGLEAAGVAELVDIEFCARFPWSGGRHPWLDAFVQTPTTIIGIESKRYEPFRDAKSASFAGAYDRPVWGDNMKRYEDLRDALRSGRTSFVHLDAAQLVKHAFGLVTEGGRRKRRPALFYLFAEPATRNGRPMETAEFQRHREEIVQFGDAVNGDEVSFHSASYREWLGMWNALPGGIDAHRRAVLESFAP